MTRSSRMPKSIPAFSVYLEGAVDYLLAGAPQTNADRLGLEEIDVQSLSDIRDRWLPLYQLYENKRNTRTSIITSQLHELMQETRDLDIDRHILDRIASSPNATLIDLSTFNIKAGALAKKAQRLTDSLEARVLPDILQMSGGVLLIKCYNNLDLRRGIVEGANSLEYRYRVSDEEPATADEEGLISGLSTKASFKLKLGQKSGNKQLHIFFRWYNTKYPELAGPWSNLFTVTIV